MTEVLFRRAGTDPDNQNWLGLTCSFKLTMFLRFTAVSQGNLRVVNFLKMVGINRLSIRLFLHSSLMETEPEIRDICKTVGKQKSYTFLVTQARTKFYHLQTRLRGSLWDQTFSCFTHGSEEYKAAVYLSAWMSESFLSYDQLATDPVFYGGHVHIVLGIALYIAYVRPRKQQ